VASTATYANAQESARPAAAAQPPSPVPRHRDPEPRASRRTWTSPGCRG